MDTSSAVTGALFTAVIGIAGILLGQGLESKRQRDRAAIEARAASQVEAAEAIFFIADALDGAMGTALAMADAAINPAYEGQFQRLDSMYQQLELRWPSQRIRARLLLWAYFGDSVSKSVTPQLEDLAARGSVVAAWSRTRATRGDREVSGADSTMLRLAYLLPENLRNIEQLLVARMQARRTESLDPLVVYQLTPLEEMKYGGGSAQP